MECEPEVFVELGTFCASDSNLSVADDKNFAIDIETGETFLCNIVFEGVVSCKGRQFMLNRISNNICPISQEVFEKAMFCINSGITYSLESIRMFIDQSRSLLIHDPVTRIPYHTCNLVRNLFFWPAHSPGETLSLVANKQKVDMLVQTDFQESRGTSRYFFLIADFVYRLEESIPFYRYSGPGGLCQHVAQSPISHHPHHRSSADLD